MNAMEILLAESQERMCYEVAPEDVARVEALAERFDLGCSVIGEVTDGNYVCEFAGAGKGEDDADDSDAGVRGRRRRGRRVPPPTAPMNDLASESPTQPDRDLPDPEPSLDEAVESVVSAPLDREQALGVPPVRPRGRCSNRDETRRRRRNHGDPRNSVDRRGRPRPGRSGRRSRALVGREPELD